VTVALADSLPPQATDAEEAVLGAALISRTAADLLVDMLEEGDFYLEAHRRFFTVVRWLLDREIDPDMLTVPQELQNRGWLDACGGPAYVTRLIESVPTAAHVEHYARIVREKADLRSVIDRAQVSMAEAYSLADERGDELTAQAVRERAEERFLNAQRRGFGAQGVNGDVWFRDVLEKLMSRGDEAPSPRSGFYRLDALVGRFEPGELFVVAGRSSMGKTEFCLQVMLHNARQGFPVQLYSLEMPRQQIGERLIAAAAGVPLRSVQGNSAPDEWTAICEAGDANRLLPMHVQDEGEMTVGAIRAHLRHAIKRDGIRLVIIDQLQTIFIPDSNEREDVRIGRTAYGLKRMAEKLAVPVILQCQLNRKPEERKDHRPLLADLRDSGAIENACDRALMLYRGSYYDRDEAGAEPESSPTEFILRKNRITGEVGTVHCVFRRSRHRFEVPTE
jgi:replicative DNA helicase